jgi:multidrug efflux pump subunit AcrA (membrane-fusion protein)
MTLLLRRPSILIVVLCLLVCACAAATAAEKMQPSTLVAVAAGDDKPDQEPDPADEADDEAEGDDDQDAKQKDADDESDKKSADPEEPNTAEDKTGDKKASDDKDADKKDADKEGKADTKAGSKEAEKSVDEKSDESKADEAKKDDKPKPFTVKKKPLKIEQKLEGIFVAEDTEEVALRPDTWARYNVVKAVEHGAEVKKGDVLVTFDDEQIEERLAEESIDQRLSELALMQAEEEAPRSEKILKLAFESAKRTYDQLVEDHKYYQETDRPFAERIAKYRFDSSKEDLASQEEELTQLKKMYEADEITEETEKIVLRRQEFEVATAKLMLELQTANRDYTLDVSLPRNDLFYATALEEGKLAMEQAKMALELGTTRSKYDLEKKRAARTRSMQANAKLLSDRDLMELKAPTDGTVYYGRCVTGQWAEIGSMTAKLVPFSMIPPNTVLMTIVKQRPLYVQTSIGEKELPDFKKGMAATLTPAADTDDELAGKVTKLAGIPGGGKKFDMRLDLDKEELPDWLVAGMSCSVEVTTYENKDALMVPADLIQTDEDNDKIKYVMLVTEDDEEPVRREVKVGKSKDKQVEILSGLKAGDKIVKEESKKEESKKGDEDEK